MAPPYKSNPIFDRSWTTDVELTFHYEQDSDPFDDPDPRVVAAVKAGQWWADTLTGALKRRNAANDDWELFSADVAVFNGLIAALDARIAVLEQTVANRLIFVSDTDPQADEGNIIIGGQTIWGDTATDTIKLRNPDNTAWIVFGTSEAPTPAAGVLLNDDDEELQFDIIELIEHGKLADLEATTTFQPTDLLALVQTVDTIGKRVALANFLIDSILAFTDVTTNDVSITKHGFCPKLPGDPDLYLCGDGTWAAFPE